MQVRRRLKLQVGEYDWQTAMGFVRLFVFGVLVVIGFGVLGGTRLDGVNPVEIADKYRASIWFFKYLPEFVLVIIGAVFNWNSARYMIAPLMAIIIVLFSGAKFVQDVYALPDFKSAWTYIVASMFGFGYPKIVIDKGEKQINKDETDLIDKIGGPGFVIIQPGNAAMFRHLRGPSKAGISETYFLAPFERIASTVNLDEQQDVKESMTAVTRDGIKVKITDIHFRYQIKHQEERKGVPVRRTPVNPFPFSEDAIRDMTFNSQVSKNGPEPKLESWQDAIKRTVTGTIADFVSSHSIDFLTAPRTGEYSPRLELQNQLFMDDVRSRLSNLGAELLWVDAGHIEIEDESVDELRTTLWAADWAGEAKEVRAYGEAIRHAYQELGRAEAQADLIMSIAGALSRASLSGNSADNIKKILLARTAQILNAMNNNMGSRDGE